MMRSHSLWRFAATRWPLAAILLWSIIPLWVEVEAKASAPPRYKAGEKLFQDIGAIQPQSETSRQRALLVKRESRTWVRADLLRAAAGQQTPELEILFNLFPDAEFRVVLDRQYPNPLGGTVWSGYVPGYLPGRVDLALDGNRLTANLQAADRIFQVRNLGEGWHLIRELDQKVFSHLIQRFQEDCGASGEEQEVVNLTNVERIAGGLGSLSCDGALVGNARGHSQNMAANNFFAHSGDPCAGYPWSACGENIAAGFPSAGAAVSAWMNSPGHRANILQPAFCDMGAGYAYDPADTFGPYYHYWTQNFGRPAGVSSCPSDPTPTTVATTTTTTTTETSTSTTTTEPSTTSSTSSTSSTTSTTTTSTTTTTTTTSTTTTTILLTGTPRGTVDVPADRATVIGLVQVSGWAAIVSGNRAGVASRVELLVDGVPVGQLNRGVFRPDVQQFFSSQGITAPDNLGYSGPWDSRSVPDGIHQLSIRAADAVGVGLEAISEIHRIAITTNNGIVPNTTTSTTTTTTTTTTSTSSTTTTSTTSSTTSTSTSTSTTSTTTSTTTTTTTTTTLPPVYRRYFPRIVSDATQTAAIAVTNLSLSPATLTFKAYSDAGTLMGISQRVLPSRHQLALLLQELFPTLGNPQGWVLLESSVPEINGFFLFFDLNLTVMDGAAVSDQLLDSFVFLMTDEGEVSLVNPTNAAAAYRLEYVTDSGSVAGALQGTIPAMGRIAVLTGNLKPAGSQGGYLRGVSRGVVPLAVFGKAGWSAALMGIDAATAPAAPRVLYAPQYVAGGGYSTTLSLVNLESTPSLLALTLVTDDGTQRGSVASVTLPAQGSVQISGPSFFGLTTGTEIVQGYVRIESTGGQFAGSVRFTDSAGTSFGTALPCVSSGQTSTTFSQVAQNELYYTGLAVLNPNGASTTLTITVYDTQGRVLATGTREMLPGRRISQVLPEWVGSLGPLTKGYIQVTSGLPLASVALFGTTNFEVLAAVPSQSTGR